MTNGKLKIQVQLTYFINLNEGVIHVCCVCGRARQGRFYPISLTHTYTHTPSPFGHAAILRPKNGGGLHFSLQNSYSVIITSPLAVTLL